MVHRCCAPIWEHMLCTKPGLPPHRSDPSSRPRKATLSHRMTWSQASQSASRKARREFFLMFGRERQRHQIGRVSVFSLQDARTAARRFLALRMLEKPIKSLQRALSKARTHSRLAPRTDCTRSVRAVVLIAIPTGEHRGAIAAWRDEWVGSRCDDRRVALAEPQAEQTSRNSLRLPILRDRLGCVEVRFSPL